MLHSVTLEDINDHDEFLQTGVWGRIKSGYSWTAYAFRYNSHPLLVLVRKLPLGFMIAYVPHGPVTTMDMPFFRAFVSGLCKKLSPALTFIRFDLPWKRESTAPIKRPFVKTSVHIQPPDTVILDISREPEKILEGMKKKTRYNIGLAQKKGLSVREEGTEQLADWYQIYQETAVRDRIEIHDPDYYVTVYNECKKSGSIYPLFLCTYFQEKMIAGILVIICGTRATYLYGASSNEHRNLMPNYLLQWEGILRSRDRGCNSYDMFGIPPADDPGHPMHGLYRFKAGFGGDIVRMAGCYDYPVKKFSYICYNILERLRDFYYKTVKKR